MKPDLLLLDGNTRSALAAYRSLTRFGLNPAVAGPKGSYPNVSETMWSKLGSAAFLELPDPAHDSEKYKKVISDFLALYTGCPVLPVTDMSLRHVLEMAAGNSDLRLFPMPPGRSIAIVQEKGAFLELAAKAGVRVPETQSVQGRKVNEWSKFPAVVKEARADGAAGREKLAAQYATTPSELNAVLKNLPVDVPFLVQERVAGEGVGVFCLCKNGEPIASFAHRRLLEKPPSGGVSVLSESIPLEEAPVRESHLLLKALNWTGVAMVEFKRTADNQFVLMEINPRFWGTLQLSIASGVDFPVLLWLLMKDELESDAGKELLAQARAYRVGQRLRWDLGTLDHLLIRLKEEGLTSLPRILFNNELMLFSGKPTAHETFSWKDSKPFVAELRQYFGSLIS